MNNFKRHACEKRPWECQHCGLKCVYGEGEGKHWSVCEKFPVVCPNGCEVGAVERCMLEQHRSVCSLEPVAREMRESSCNVVLPHKEMVAHMKENKMQHLTTTAALSLRLTRQLQQECAEAKEKILLQQKEIDEQKKLITELLEEQNKIQAEMHLKLEAQKKELMTSFQSAEMQRPNAAYVAFEVPPYMKYYHVLFSDPFYSHHHGCRFKLGMYVSNKSDRSIEVKRYKVLQYLGFEEEKEDEKGKEADEEVKDSFSDNRIGFLLWLIKGDYDEHLQWPVEVRVQLQLLNQAGDHHHLVKTSNILLNKENREMEGGCFFFEYRLYRCNINPSGEVGIFAHHFS